MAGLFFYLYLILDIYSRKIVGFEVHDREAAILSSRLMEETLESEGIDGKELVLHSDNGAPMKGATMLATLQNLGVIPSFSRPSVSDDNPYSEALFKTAKYSLSTLPFLFLPSRSGEIGRGNSSAGTKSSHTAESNSLRQISGTEGKMSRS